MALGTDWRYPHPLVRLWRRLQGRVVCRLRGGHRYDGDICIDCGATVTVTIVIALDLWDGFDQRVPYAFLVTDAEKVTRAHIRGDFMAKLGIAREDIESAEETLQMLAEGLCKIEPTGEGNDGFFVRDATSQYCDLKVSYVKRFRGYEREYIVTQESSNLGLAVPQTTSVLPRKWLRTESA